MAAKGTREPLTLVIHADKSVSYELLAHLALLAGQTRDGKGAKSMIVRARIKSGDELDVGYANGLIVLRKRRAMTPARVAQACGGIRKAGGPGRENRRGCG